jgi:hypothetical protein
MLYDGVNSWVGGTFPIYKAKLGCNLVLLLAPYFGNAPTIRLYTTKNLWREWVFIAKC